MDNSQLGRGTDGAAPPSPRPGALRRLGLPAAALSLALGAAQVAAAAPGFAASTSSAKVAVGHAPALPKGAVSAAAPAADKKLSLDVELNTGHAAELSAYAAAVSDKNSSYYHHYLTPSQVAEYFGASQGEISAVQASLKAQGLTLGSVSSNHMFLTVTGTVSQVESALNVTIKGYKAAGRSFYANTAAPAVPASVASDISGFLGIDDVDYAVPNISSKSHAVKAASVSAKVTSNYTVNSCSNMTTALGNGGLVNGTGYYSDDAISNVYGLSSLLTNGNDGAGVTVGVFELEAYDAAGVSTLDSCYGHSSTSVTEQAVDGGATTAANAANNVGVESALDLENIANLAPGASVIDYEGPDAASASDSQILDVFNAMTTADTAKVISDSWGLCEVVTQAGDSTMQASENTVFETAATQGQSILVASGDNGSTDCYNAGVTADQSVLSVDDPSSQPYATAVGGTGMTGLSNPTPHTWNQACSTVADCGASGGGVSDTWPLPTWQSGDTAAGYNANCTSTVTQGGTGCRQVPDVSALADPNDGYVIEEYYDDGTNPAGEYYFTIGGTSGAAPVWAAVLALADASATCKVGGNAGFVNPQLYTVGKLSKTALSAFATDVTTGNNKIALEGASFGYSATTGYDMATGWGTPKAAGVVSTVCQAPSYYQQDGPVRLLDTRKTSQIGTVTGPVAKGGTVSVQVTGNSGVPSGATAAVLNVTATSPTGGGNATVYPATSTMPLTSNLNWVAGNTKANLVVVPLNSDGAVKITNNSTGTVQFIADLEGYFTTSTSVSSVTSSSYTPVNPIRAMDTRTSGNGVAQGKLAGQGTVKLQVGGATITAIGGTATQTIPSGITGIAMNVTVTNPTSGGFLAVYPNENSAGTTIAVPNVSNINFGKGQTIPNTVMVPVGKDGIVDFHNGELSTGSIDVIADIAGYYTSGTSGDVYHPLGPVRVVDTRIGEGESSTAPIAGKGKLDLGLPSSYAAVVANLTVVSPQVGGYLNAYPLGTATPNSSNVNFGAGETVPNSAIVQSDSGLEFYNNASGTVQLVVDLSGYFSAK
ncbi:MAG TPA: S53 family peptidase [Actinospica sp.]|nr:S53 family peptidase [Actinospica sp.]